jgi:hypothetical protein
MESSVSEDERLIDEWKSFRNHVTKDKSAEQLNREECIWAAGLWDGEGHAGANIPDDLSTKSPRMVLAMKQAYGELGLMNLQRFQAAVGGVGQITGPYKNSSDGSGPYHLWSVAGESDVEKVWSALGPYLGPAKFNQFKGVLQVAAIRAIRSDVFGTRSRHRPNVHIHTVDDARPDPENQ